MINAYWWEGMRQPEAGYGGTLWIKCAGLFQAGEVRWGPHPLGTARYAGAGLWGVRLPDRPLENGSHAWPVWIGNVAGGPLTLHTHWPRPRGEVAGYTRPGTDPPLPLRRLTHFGLFRMELSETSHTDVSRVAWGASEFDLRGTRGPGEVVASVPAGTPCGEAAVAVYFKDGTRWWGPPLIVMPAD